MRENNNSEEADIPQETSLGGRAGRTMVLDTRRVEGLIALLHFA